MALKSRGHTNLGFHCKVKVHQLCAERSPPTFLRGTQRIMNLFEPLQFCIKLHSQGHQPFFLCRKKSEKVDFNYLLFQRFISLTGFSFPQVSGCKLLKFRGANSSSFGATFPKNKHTKGEPRRFHQTRPPKTEKNCHTHTHAHTPGPSKGCQMDVRGATKQSLRVQTPPLGGCWHTPQYSNFSSYPP